MRVYIFVLALSSVGLLHVSVSASSSSSLSSDGVPEPAPARAPDELASDATDEEDTRNYAPLDVNDLAPPSSPVGARVEGVAGLHGPHQWRLQPSPELVDALRAALELESEVMELRNANDDSFDVRPSGEWASPTLGQTNEGGLEGGRQLPKRAPTGFTGMRGRRIPSGFNGMRGKKSLSLFTWNNQALQSPAFLKTYRDGKRAPSGFLGMRGKKSFDTSLDEQWSMDDLSLGRPAKEYANFLVLDPTPFGASMHVNPAPYKRVPNGFMGLRGKK